MADFGCGPGLFLEYIANEYPQAKLFGFEYSSVALEIARSNCPNAFLAQHDLTRPIEKDLEFDFIVCSQTLEHVHFPNLALANIFAASSENGRIVITVPDGRVDTYEGHFNFWSPESFEIWIRDHLPGQAMVEFDVLPRGSGFDYLIAIIDMPLVDQ
ncbi:class I SAM-dependent methyltransferase [Anabaena sp. CS-542/02]|uniref:class I SAM-dependent methyltransferase n=1 Tax=Anabaena sp. CS-542/02 TaxID=3021719 RepID=UPI00232FC573|nr:class I SAM-dependent methyltransferase [Anabaena sp. CS-542/02]MDB9444804.1 class I SAM-dependent methyltransferase [Anabaena sp. CS-542/02]